MNVRLICLLTGFLLWGGVSLAQSDIELTDSTSTEWGGGGGGGISPSIPNDPVTSMTISRTTLTLEGGESARLTVTFNPRAKDKRVTWSVANPKVCSVSNNGTVVGLGKGTTIVTATSDADNTFKCTCTVTVTSDYVPPVSGWILPWGKDEEWTMRYIYQEQGSFVEPSDDTAGRNWKQLDYDDSQWQSLTGPMGSDNIWYSTCNYRWNGSYDCFCLRREFDLLVVSDEFEYTFFAQHDDGILVYFNGELAVDDQSWTGETIISYDIPPHFMKQGRNQLAIYIKHDTGKSFLDYGLYFKTPRKATYAPLPNVPFEFYYNAKDYDAETHDIPNQENANLAGASLQLTENLPEFVDGELLRINDRCEGYIDQWEKWSSESGAYFFRQGQDCMTIVAKVAPQYHPNAGDLIANRAGGYNYMWRILSGEMSFLHTGNGDPNERSIPVTPGEPQVLAVRVNGVEDYILLENLTTGVSLRIDGIYWGGGDNAFKLFFNDGGEFYLGDFYWVYYSFELLTDDELDQVVRCGEAPSVLLGDVNSDGKVTPSDAIMILYHFFNVEQTGFNAAAADVNGDSNITPADAIEALYLYFGVSGNPSTPQPLEPL